MTYEVLLRPEAEIDIGEAYQWYETQAEGLGEEFLRAVDACFAAMQRNPTTYALIHKFTAQVSVWPVLFDRGGSNYSTRLLSCPS